jgi:hypothetical protein
MVLGVLSSHALLLVVARETSEGFFLKKKKIVFLLFLNKNIFSLDLLLVVIYGVKFYLFS